MQPHAVNAASHPYEVTHSDAEWHKLLTPAQYQVLREEGTERPFTSALLEEHRAGTFTCAGCDLQLFAAKTKFESGTGWPSFYAPLEGAVDEVEDRTFGMLRTAVSCHRCGGHLGHVFPDGPKPTGLRYCMNGVALKFAPGPGSNS
ncbi:MAG TPA: peptide-methionine (R)-S-oxide reductase MsrB [Xanthobacteraceae bacterium]|nr:peptide-methionine (R)-S-oxide reductase MsrB [Xanthobacteraceae bacterium]